MQKEKPFEDGSNKVQKLNEMDSVENRFAIHSRRVLTPEGIREAWVYIHGDKIISVNDHAPVGIEIHSVNDLVLMPGLIDSHVHINEPGRTEWEGFDTATKAAAAGGITTLVDMPLNSSPVTTRGIAFEAKVSSSHGQLHVNCGFYGGLVPDNADEIALLVNMGVLGIKAFLSPSGIDEFPNVTEANLREAIPAITRSGLPLLVHSELVSDHPDIDLPAKFPHSYDAWLRSRPMQWENDAIQLLIRLCREYKCRTHIVHLSSSEALDMLKVAQAEGLPITVETCPHYLVFSAEDIEDRATLFKCAPPIRGKANNELLWEGLRSGIITMIVTDHSPATEDLKGIEHGKFSEAWGGIASLQFSLPATWTFAQQRNFTLKDISRWMSSNVARFLDLEQTKGCIAAGYDADLVAWDPEAACDTSKKNIFHRNPVSPYTDMQLKGRVHQTWVNGKMVFDQGKFPNLGEGKIILRNLSNEN